MLPIYIDDWMMGKLRGCFYFDNAPHVLPLPSHPFLDRLIASLPRQVDCMEYKKITVRVGRESYGAGIEFGTNPAEQENEDMLREEEEEPAAISPAKAKTATYIRKMPKKKSTFGRIQRSTRNKKNPVTPSTARVPSLPAAVAEATPSPSSRQQLARTITQLEKINANLLTELAALKAGMTDMHAESKRKTVMIEALKASHSQELALKDLVIKELNKHNRADRKAVNDVSIVQCARLICLLLCPHY